MQKRKNFFSPLSPWLRGAGGHDALAMAERARAARFRSVFFFAILNILLVNATFPPLSPAAACAFKHDLHFSRISRNNIFARFRFVFGNAFFVFKMESHDESANSFPLAYEIESPKNNNNSFCALPADGKDIVSLKKQKHWLCISPVLFALQLFAKISREFFLWWSIMDCVTAEIERRKLLRIAIALAEDFSPTRNNSGWSDNRPYH